MVPRVVRLEQRPLVLLRTDAEPRHRVEDALHPLGRLRAASVSSIRSTIVPPDCRANTQLNSRERALPTWNIPVGEGAKRTRSAGPFTRLHYRSPILTFRSNARLSERSPAQQARGIACAQLMINACMRSSRDVPTTATRSGDSKRCQQERAQTGPGSSSPRPAHATTSLPSGTATVVPSSRRLWQGPSLTSPQSRRPCFSHCRWMSFIQCVVR